MVNFPDISNADVGTHSEQRGIICRSARVQALGQACAQRLKRRWFCYHHAPINAQRKTHARPKRVLPGDTIRVFAFSVDVARLTIDTEPRATRAAFPSGSVRSHKRRARIGCGFVIAALCCLRLFTPHHRQTQHTQQNPLHPRRSHVTPVFAVSARCSRGKTPLRRACFTWQTIAKSNNTIITERPRSQCLFSIQD